MSTRRRAAAVATDISFRAGVRLLCAAIVSALPAAVLAQPKLSLTECAAIDADRERLACYDRASGRAAVTAPAAPPASAAAAEPPRPVVDAPSRAGAAHVETATGTTRAASLIDTAWGFDPSSQRYTISLYQPNYFLFARYSDNVNNQPFTPIFPALQAPPESIDDVEAKFQLSFKVRLWTTDDRRWGAWVAYTQQSNWQLYNDDQSRPFRDTNYMPEIFGSYRPGLALGRSWQWNLINVGYNHQSNGRSDVLSRSWDRVYAEFGVERENIALLGRVWYPFNEDDNPDIADYYGYGSLTAIYKLNGHSFSLMLRGNLSERRGAGQLTWMSPKILGPLRAYVQAFTGYGETLLDYNWPQNTIGVGVALNDML